MKSSLAKFGLFAAAVIISYFPASYIGHWYNQITPQYGTFITGVDDAIIFAGWLLSFGFFVPFAFSLFGFKKNIKWIIIFLTVPTLLWLSSDLYHIYIPIAFGLAGFILAKLIHLTISKFRHPNPPMVIK